jgi:5-hydroxyisourate hydrolase-like protein (transthyretin family)
MTEITKWDLENGVGTIELDINGAKAKLVVPKKAADVGVCHFWCHTIWHNERHKIISNEVEKKDGRIYDTLWVGSYDAGMKYPVKFDITDFWGKGLNFDSKPGELPDGKLVAGFF